MLCSICLQTDKFEVWLPARTLLPRWRRRPFVQVDSRSNSPPISQSFLIATVPHYYRQPAHVSPTEWLQYSHYAYPLQFGSTKSTATLIELATLPRCDHCITILPYSGQQFCIISDVFPSTFVNTHVPSPSPYMSLNCCIAPMLSISLYLSTFTLPHLAVRRFVAIILQGPIRYHDAVIISHHI